MGLSIYNFADGSTISVSTGGIAKVDVQAATILNNIAVGQRSILVQADTAIPTVYESATVGGILYGAYTLTETCGATASGDLSPSATSMPIPVGNIQATPGSSYTPAALVQFTPNVPPGFYSIQVSIVSAVGMEYCTLLVRVLPAFNLPFSAPLAWVPAGMADLQVNMDEGVVASGTLCRMQGLLQGEDFSLAIVPKLGGAIVTAGITAISISILDKINSSYAPIVFTAASLVPTVVVATTEEYYVITGNLRDAKVQRWFDDVNHAIDTQNAAALAANPSAVPIPYPGTLQTLAQISITTAAGITTTQLFPLPIVELLASTDTTTDQATNYTAVFDSIDLAWDVMLGSVTAVQPTPAITTLPDGETPLLQPLFWLKHKDTRLIHVRPMKGATVLDIAFDTLSFTIKTNEPDAVTVSTAYFVRVGLGNNTFYRLAMTVDSEELIGALSDSESDNGTAVVFIGEFEATHDISALTPALPGGAPTEGRTSSRYFGVGIERNLTP